MWEGDVRALLIVVAIALGGCAAQRLNFSMYTRSDGRPVDPAQQQAVFAQCKGEGATAGVQFTGGPYGVVERERKEADVVNACMARNGYIQARQ
jgi:hypothetical protein